MDMPLHVLIAYLLVAFLLILAIYCIGVWARSRRKFDDSVPVGCLVFVLLLLAGLISLVFGL